MRMPGFVRGFFNWIRRLLKAFLDGDCPMHAAGLTYYVLLSVVPILCCILVAAKTCHIDSFARDQINGKIDALIVNIEKGQDDVLVTALPVFDEKEREKKRIAAEEFARTARQISNQLFERIEQFDISTFGWIGFGFLLWTVISTLASVETSFNGIFGVAQPRPIWKRAYMYLLIIIVLPLLATVAMSLPILRVVKDILVATLGATWLTKWVSDGLIWILDSWVFSLCFTLLSSTGAFAFVFWVMPNCRVPFRHAAWGGLVTSVLFGGWLKVCAIAQVGIAKFSALYGSFAFLPIVLAWIYMSWQIVLFGATLVRSFDVRK